MTSIDVMGCQETIVKKIREKEGDYLLAVKNNRRDLFQSIEDTFRLQPKKEEDFATELDTGHGRIEQRTCYLSRDLSLIDTTKWQDAILRPCA